MDNWHTLLEFLEQYRDCSSRISYFMAMYEQECSNIICKMKDRIFEDCKQEFDILFNIQNKLSMAKYKYGYKLNKRLDDFIFHFERDDVYIRKYWYDRFHNGMLWPED